jgi:hypothetical protein
MIRLTRKPIGFPIVRTFWRIAYFLFGVEAGGRRCERSEAATDFSCGVLFGFDKILLAIEASFLPVVMALSSEGDKIMWISPDSVQKIL